jgi:hypothetical protein
VCGVCVVPALRVCVRKKRRGKPRNPEGITTGRREETTSMLELLEHELLGLLPRVFGVS